MAYDRAQWRGTHSYISWNYRIQFSASGCAMHLLARWSNAVDSCYIRLLRTEWKHRTAVHSCRHASNIHMNLTEFGTVNYAIYSFNGTTQTMWHSHVCREQLNSSVVQTSSTEQVNTTWASRTRTEPTRLLLTAAGHPLVWMTSTTLIGMQSYRNKGYAVYWLKIPDSPVAVYEACLVILVSLFRNLNTANEITWYNDWWKAQQTPFNT